ncbi:MAG: NUDIX hydrolase [Verrucomicrobia bacterium]|nr:NUDIX hydrolase [Verrucomicrobiota bacterium]
MTEKSEKEKELDLSAKKEVALAYQGKVISVYKEILHRKNGEVVTRDIVKHPGAVAIIPVDETGHILFIKQWRLATETILIEIPAGTLEQDEDPLGCANRELQEEIGFRAETMIPLGGFYTAPGFCSEYIHLFLAKDLLPSSLWADDSDYIDLFALSLEEALSLVADGAFLDSKTLSALNLYQLWLKKNSL